jgi:hypothetical protein
VLDTDDGQRKCPKLVEFYSKNKCEKLVRVVGFVIRNFRVISHLNFVGFCSHKDSNDAQSSVDVHKAFLVRLYVKVLQLLPFCHTHFVFHQVAVANEKLNNCYLTTHIEC